MCVAKPTVLRIFTLIPRLLTYPVGSGGSGGGESLPAEGMVDRSVDSGWVVEAGW